MDVLMVAAELAPYERATDAADLIFALTKTLRQLGHRVTVALPRYPSFEAHGLLAARRLTPLALPGGGEITVFDGPLSSGGRARAVRHPGARRGGRARRRSAAHGGRFRRFSVARAGHGGTRAPAPRAAAHRRAARARLAGWARL